LKTHLIPSLSGMKKSSGVEKKLEFFRIPGKKMND